MELRGRVVEHDRRFRFRSLSWGQPPLPVTPSNLAAGDFDGDGMTEAAVVGTDAAVVFVGRPLTDHLSFRQWTLSEAVRWIVLTTADADGDGRDDLLGLSSEGTLRAFASNGADAFTELPLPTEIPPTKDAVIATFDRNCDGKADIAFWNREEKRLYNVVSRRHRPKTTANSPAVLDVDQLLGGNFEEDDCGSMLLSYQPPAATYRWALTYRKKRALMWAELDSRAIWDGAVTGDFSGDGLTDLMVYASEPLPGWWGAISNGRIGIEQYVEGPSFAYSRERPPLVGDFNADGFADLLTVEEETGSLTVHLNVPGPGIPGVKVSAPGGAPAVTDADGAFALSVPPSKGTLRAEIAEYALSRSQREFTGRTVRPLNFIAYRLSSSVGRNETFGAPPQGPFVCTGYNPTESWKWGHTPLCPESSAIFSSAAIRPYESRNDAEVRVQAFCCKLPTDDILTDEEVWVEAACPEGFVATGSDPGYGCHNCPKLMRCNRINEQRYQLGPPQEGAYWGTGFSMKREPHHLHKSAFPLALRYAMARGAFNAWDFDGCTARTPGHLLVAKHRSGCSGLRYRELQYHGRKGDPPAGTPVQIFPPCTRMENIYDPLGGCWTDDAASPASGKSN